MRNIHHEAMPLPDWWYKKHKSFKKVMIFFFPLLCTTDCWNKKKRSNSFLKNCKKGNMITLWYIDGCIWTMLQKAHNCFSMTSLGVTITQFSVRQNNFSSVALLSWVFSHYVALNSILNTLRILGLASGEILTHAKATFKTDSIWLWTASDALQTLESRIFSLSSSLVE